MLHHAINTDYLSIAKLLAAGVDPNAYDYSGSSALLRASFQRRKHPEPFMLPLIGAGADIQATDNSGRTPLSVATTVGDNHQTIRFLIHHGANLEIPNAFDDIQPLITAIIFQEAKYVDVLIEAGADCAIVARKIVDHASCRKRSRPCDVEDTFQMAK